MGFSLKSERERVLKESVHPMHTRYGGREPHTLRFSQWEATAYGWQLEGRVARPALEGGRCELMGWKSKTGRWPGRGCAGGIAAVAADSGDPGRFPRPRGEGLCRATPVRAGASRPLGIGASSPLPGSSGLVTQRDASLRGRVGCCLSASSREQH